MALVLIILVPILKIIEFLLKTIYNLTIPKKYSKIPPLEEKYLEISATDLAEAIRKMEISSEAICLKYINRIKRINPIINAIVEDRFDSALKEAQDIDEFLRNAPLIKREELARTKPLLGVPVTVKESCSVLGMSLSGGTLRRVAIKAEKDGDAVLRLKSSGAIILLVSNTPELCLSWECRNFVTGVTKNPYDLGRSSGGSSGGEGALLGAGASVIGIGSDVAGSIRVPALFCGVFGHKPTPRLISIKEHYPYIDDDRIPDYLVIGPLTRYAKDLKLMMTVLSTTDLNIRQKVDLSSLKVYPLVQMPGTPLFCDVQTEIKQTIYKSIDYLRDYSKCTVINRNFHEFNDFVEISGSTLFSINGIPNLLKEEHENLTLELCKSFLGQSKYTFNLLHFYVVQGIFKRFMSNKHFLQRQLKMKKTLMEILGDNGVILMPTIPHSAIMHTLSPMNVWSVGYVMIWNILGFPSTHVPCGLDRNGLPIGIQVIAAPNQDRLCLAMAEELERCFGGWIAPPS